MQVFDNKIINLTKTFAKKMQKKLLLTIKKKNSYFALYNFNHSLTKNIVLSIYMSTSVGICSM